MILHTQTFSRKCLQAYLFYLATIIVYTWENTHYDGDLPFYTCSIRRLISVHARNTFNNKYKWITTFTDTFTHRSRTLRLIRRLLTNRPHKAASPLISKWLHVVLLGRFSSGPRDSCYKVADYTHTNVFWWKILDSYNNAHTTITFSVGDTFDYI